MNQNNIDCRGWIQPRHGVNGGCGSEFGNRSYHYYDIKQSWSVGICGQSLSQSQPQATAMVGGIEESSPYTDPAPAKSSTTIMSQFEPPASAFYVSERCMGFQQYESLLGNPSLSSQFSKINDLEFPLYQLPRENLLLDSANQADPKLELSNTLQAMVKSQLNGDRYCKSPEKSNKIPCGNLSANKFLPIEQEKLFIDEALRRKLSIPFEGNQDHTVACDSYNLPVGQLSFSSQQEQLSPALSSASISNASGKPTSNGSMVSSKTRIRWTQALHDKFVESVNRLGGADKATPKSILKLMDSDGLTIFHIKSHLQKYRIAKYMPDSTQGKSEKGTPLVDAYHIDVKTGMQLREALQMQLDVQRHLHEQLEIQRKLQLRIEEQGEQLRMMFDQQQKTSKSPLNCEKQGTKASDEKSTSPKDIGVSISEGSGNSFFPSKIS